MSEIRRCEVCGKKLKARNKKYCCAACRTKAQEERREELLRAEKRVCKFCGEEFTPDRHHSKYCSEECRTAYYAKNSAANISERECPICHKMFVPKSDKGVYCSKKCRQRVGTYYGMYREKPEVDRAKKRQTDLRRAMSKISEYNKSHGTNYSYGQAVRMGIV